LLSMVCGRTMGHEKMLGQDILVGTITHYDQESQDIYLPRGRWTDFRSHRSVSSEGQWFKDVANTWQGHVAPPMFVRAGAILPMAAITDSTLNTLDPQPILRLRVYPGDAPSQRHLIEDDNLSPAYLTGEMRRTPLTQQPMAVGGRKDGGLAITIGAATGHYQGEQKQRGALIEVITDRKVSSVSLNGSKLQTVKFIDQDRVGQAGYLASNDGVVRIRVPKQDVRTVSEITLIFASSSSSETGR
jgi:hypothetical protein